PIPPATIDEDDPVIVASPPSPVVPLPLIIKKGGVRTAAETSTLPIVCHSCIRHALPVGECHIPSTSECGISLTIHRQISLTRKSGVSFVSHCSASLPCHRGVASASSRRISLRSRCGVAFAGHCR